MSAANRDRVTAAANEIDIRLRTNPEIEGESRTRARRILLVPPLGVTFEVHPDDRLVRVLEVWRFPIGRMPPPFREPLFTASVTSTDLNRHSNHIGQTHGPSHIAPTFISGFAFVTQDVLSCVRKRHGVAAPGRFVIGHEHRRSPGAKRHQVDYAFGSTKLWSVESTAAPNDNSLVWADDATAVWKKSCYMLAVCLPLWVAMTLLRAPCATTCSRRT